MVFEAWTGSQFITTFFGEEIPEAIEDIFGAGLLGEENFEIFVLGLGKCFKELLEVSRFSNILIAKYQ